MKVLMIKRRILFGSLEIIFPGSVIISQEYEETKRQK
jgi:hypothetical protein